MRWFEEARAFFPDLFLALLCMVWLRRLGLSRDHTGAATQPSHQPSFWVKAGRAQLIQPPWFADRETEARIGARPCPHHCVHLWQIQYITQSHLNPDPALFSPTVLSFWAERADFRANYFSGHLLRMSQNTKDFTHIIPLAAHRSALTLISEMRKLRLKKTN